MIPMRRTFALIIVLLLALLLVPVSGAFAGAPPPGKGAGPQRMPTAGARPDYAPNQVIVKFKDGTGGSRRSAVKRSANVKATLKDIGPGGSSGTQLLQLEPGVSVESAVAELQSNTEVAYAEPNYLMHKTYTPTSDPEFSKQWGLNNTGQTIGTQTGTPDADIDAPEAWDVEKGNTTPVTIAIIDTGADLNHPDLSSKYVAGYNFAGISQYMDSYLNGSDNPYAIYRFGETTNQQLAQSITGTGQNLTSVGLEFYKKGNPTSTITVSVRSSLDGADLASYTVSSGEVSDSEVTSGFKYLSSPVMLTNGTTYYIVIRTDTTSASDYYYLTFNPAGFDYNVDEYREGTMYENTGGWTDLSPFDLFFYTNPNAVPHDDNGHGTHCAGIAAAVEGNTKGGVGVSFGAKVMPVKVADSSGLSSSTDVSSGIDFAADNGAKIISISYSSSNFSQTMQNAINHAHNTHGVIVFASAGNSGDTSSRYPGCCANVVSVGATDNTDHYTAFSTYNAFVDLSAPGKDVYSTLPTYICEMNSYGYLQYYDYATGTSMACPMAAGLGALVRSKYPTLTGDQVQRRMQTNADDKGEPGRDDYYGWGRINAFRTLTNPVPTTTSISPVSRTAGQSAFTLTVNGTNFVEGLSKVRWNGANRPTTYVSANKLTAVISAADIASAGTAKVTAFNPAAGAGISNAQTFTINAKPTPTPTPKPPSPPEPPVPPSPNSTWYLPEGSTAWGFGTRICIANPNTSSVHAEITYMTTSGPVSGGTVSMPAKSRATIYPEKPSEPLGPQEFIGPMHSQDFSTKVVCKEGKTICVDRTMSWAGETHSSVGVTSPAKTWYLPEGSTNYGFETWLLIQNPNGSPANCTLTYMIEGAGPKTVKHTVPANSRDTYSMYSDIGNADASVMIQSDQPVIPERSMYRTNNNKREGSNSMGTTTPSKDYYLAEGTSAWGYTTYVLVQNPNSSSATVTVTYMTEKGPVAQPAFDMPGYSRKTIRVNDVLPDKDFSTQIHGTTPIIAERAMYWDKGTGEACHDSIGLDSPHTTFYLPDGESSRGWTTYTLVQNPNNSAAEIQVTYMTPTGKNNVINVFTIPANSRKTLNMADFIPSGKAAIMVDCKTAGVKIMVERAMYCLEFSAGTDTIGGYSDSD